MSVYFGVFAGYDLAGLSYKRNLESIPPTQTIGKMIIFSMSYFSESILNLTLKRLLSLARFNLFE